MIRMRTIKEKFINLPISKKVRILIAMVFTLAQLVLIGVLAWFTNQREIETMTRIKNPPTLNLASGHEDGISGFELRGIDVTKGTKVENSDDEYYKDYVFSVEPGKISQYDLQIAHTTNIPFEYELFRAKEDDNGDVEYTALDGNQYKYSIFGSAEVEGIPQGISLSDVNPDGGGTGRVLGDEGSLPTERKNYDNSDTVDIYAKPLYSVARDIRRNDISIDGSDDRDYFVLRLTWTLNDNPSPSENEWNFAYNNKETDIVYISAQASTN
ncbi:MAG: hypothetical protein K6G63_02060 [Eubacterium sp.]|nr:hypothetical protein [Eubacterium sp.]